MMEAEWITKENPTALLDYVCRNSSVRKQRQFVIALARGMSADLVELRSWRSLELSEQMVDGQVQAKEGDYSQWIARQALHAVRQRVCQFDSNSNDSSHPQIHAASLVLLAASDQWDGVEPYLNFEFFSPSITRVWPAVHCIFGNPFRPVTFAPAWLTSTAVDIARAIYDDRAFDRLPILADALQDAGCEDADILGHCRGDGPHVRGCWVVDGLLGKS